MKKNFDDFIEIIEGDVYQNALRSLKNRYLNDASDSAEDCLLEYEKQKELLRLRTYHEWLTSDF